MISAHDSLMTVSPGYREFYAKLHSCYFDDDVEAFADWMTIPGECTDGYASWTAEQFDVEWEHWNS